MFGIGENELIIILVFAFLLFGPDKLPGIGRTIGRVLRQFREASEGFTEVVQTNVIDPATQELNNAGSNKRTPSAAQKPEVDDDDADIEEGSEAAQAEAPRKRETFAERKARLEAEKAARETAAAAHVAEDADDSDADADVTEGPAPAARNADSGKAEPEEPARPSVADLYARGSRRSSRAKAEDAEAPGPDASGEATDAGVTSQDGTEEEGGEADA